MRTIIIYMLCKKHHSFSTLHHFLNFKKLTLLNINYTKCKTIYSSS